MLFNSMDFIIFFPVVTLAYYIMPKKLKAAWLLIASYYFYMSWNPKYAILIALSTLITYASGLLISRADSNSKKKLVLAMSLISNLAILAIFKYANFFFDSVTAIMSQFGISVSSIHLDLLLPVGISFYTFQALSYSIDVYKGTIKPEKNIINYALFVSFFPQLVAGPIERSGNLLSQINKLQDTILFSYDSFTHGLFIMMWGFFEKLIIADRAAIIVDAVYNNYSEHGFIAITLATILFAFQVYCDFDGYTNIARGAALTLGINLIPNFKQPYLATSIRDFWHRWHISLTTWFTDYLYIPLGGNRKGLTRQLLNIVIVFTLSGLWHGASWNYVIWGLIHALYQIVEILVSKYTKHKKTTANTFSYKLRHVISTFILTDIAWIFFRANSLSDAFNIITQARIGLYIFDASALMLTSFDAIVLVLGIITLIAVDLIHERGIVIYDRLIKEEVWFKYLFVLAFLWIIIMLGVYGISYTSSQFIYFQF